MAFVYVAWHCFLILGSQSIFASELNTMYVPKLVFQNSLAVCTDHAQVDKVFVLVIVCIKCVFDSASRC